VCFANSGALGDGAQMHIIHFCVRDGNKRFASQKDKKQRHSKFDALKENHHNVLTLQTSDKRFKDISKISCINLIQCVGTTTPAGSIL